MGMAVRRARTLTTDMRQAVVDEPSHEDVDHPVVALASFLTSGHQPEMSQNGELVADGRHRKPQPVGEVADTALLVGESVQEPKPQGIRKGEKDLDGLGSRLVGRKVGAEIADPAVVVDLWQPRSHS